jgi:hypothetical protein
MGIKEVEQELANLTGRIDRVVEGFTRVVNELEGKVNAMRDALNTELTVCMESVTTHIEGGHAELVLEVENLIAKVDGRNKSAPIKRNMTDADALEILNGSFADLDHKTAAEKIGLTYAQVYSCRGGYTFKHVIHELEKAGWKNKWEKATKK